MKLTIFLSLAALLLAGSAQEEFFDREADWEADREFNERSLRLSKQTIGMLDDTLLMFFLLQIEQGDCAPAIEIEGEAKSGSAKHQWLLADLYRRGLCVSASETEMVRWLKAASDNGHKEASYELGSAILETDPTEAISAFEKAAALSHGEAARSLGLIYLEGGIVPKSQSLGIQWLERAVDLGSQDASAKLAFLYIDGTLGSQPNPDKAMSFARPAAESGHAMSQILMSVAVGIKVEAGGVTDEELIDAHKWANLASTSENEFIAEQAREIRSSLEPALTESQLSKAEEMAADWSPSASNNETVISKAPDLPIVNTSLAEQQSPTEAREKLIEFCGAITRNCLREAIQTDNLGLTKMYLRAGADPDWKIGLGGQTAIHIATDYGAEKTFDYLLDLGVDLNIPGDNGQTALVRAISHNKPQMIDRLLRAGASAKDFSEPNTFDAGALAYALMDGDNPELAERLLRHGASAQEIYTYGATPIMRAATESATLVRVLMDHGAKLKAQDQFGATVLNYATRKTEIDSEILRLLLEAGANPAGGTTPVTPLLRAVWIGDPGATLILLRYGADPNEKYQIATANIPMNAPQNFRPIIKSGGTPLMVAAHFGHASVVKTLLSFEADPNVQIQINGKEITAADIARDGGRSLVLGLLDGI